MSVPFRHQDHAPAIQHRPLVARITARQYARLRTYLEAEALRQGRDILRQDEEEPGALNHELTACIETLALAALAKLFDYDADVIAVLDEAQFARVKIRTRRLPASGDILLELVAPDPIDGMSVTACQGGRP